MSPHALAVWLPAAALLVALTMPVSGEARLLELTFDDGPDGSGVADGQAELDNLERRSGSLGEGELTARFTGTARRSALSEGRYGRAADFPDGGGAIVVEGWEGLSVGDMFASFWVKPRVVSSGNLLERAGLFAVGLEDGEIVVTTGGGVTITPTGALLPADATFHHVGVTVTLGGDTPVLGFAVDFEPAGEIAVPLEPGPPDAPVLFGSGLDGMIDEILVSQGTPGEADLFDFDPSYCPEGLECLEEVITLVPAGFPHEVPVRFKSVSRPDLCSDASPCPLLFDISGGNNCADDYAQPGSVRAFADAGFMVVTVDPYCEGDEDTRTYPTETSQLVAVKDFVLSSSAVADRISGTDYGATGCSHGAGTVVSWVLHEQDHPARTFARSPGVDGHCALHAGKLCPAVAEYYEARFAQTLGAHDDESAAARAFHESANSVDALTPDIVTSRELAVSWGVNLTGPICDADGTQACNEEGLWGMTYGNRRLRDVWQRMQLADEPSGYFVEDHSEDCKHCAAPGGEAFECGLCLLRYGRAAMADTCPACLGYDDPDIDPGGAAEACPIDASWYEDPLSVEPVQGPDAGPVADAAPAPDASTPPDGEGSSGCSCSAAGPRSSGPGIALLAAALVSVLRRRLRGRRSP